LFLPKPASSQRIAFGLFRSYTFPQRVPPRTERGRVPPGRARSSPIGIGAGADRRGANRSSLSNAGTLRLAGTTDAAPPPPRRRLVAEGLLKHLEGPLDLLRMLVDLLDDLLDIQILEGHAGFAHLLDDLIRELTVLVGGELEGARDDVQRHPDGDLLEHDE